MTCAPDANRQRAEGADAPSPDTRVRGTDRNVLEIHQEPSASPTPARPPSRCSPRPVRPTPNAASIGGTNPVVNEIDWQTRQELIQIGRDVEAGFITGTFQEPTDNSYSTTPTSHFPYSWTSRFAMTAPPQLQCPNGAAVLEASASNDAVGARD
ncbi:SU10 major capsid protein [Amycolatopsis sp. BJA-103]|uniref:SU10 major capsid protein n=1 Tax=Amycolatopsis sp. BJA-103 TaxID=1911175 RepID=UPI003FA4BBF1